MRQGQGGAVGGEGGQGIDVRGQVDHTDTGQDEGARGSGWLVGVELVVLGLAGWLVSGVAADQYSWALLSL